MEPTGIASLTATALLLTGISVREALNAIGYLGVGKPPFAAAYAEIHIEQGRVLEREGIEIGAVESNWHVIKLRIEVTGEQSHTGATLMEDRRDALVAASRVVIAMNDLAKEYALGTMLSSVGKMTIEPNSPNVVARRVVLTGDVRASKASVVDEAGRRILDACQDIAAMHDVQIEVSDLDRRPKAYYPLAGIELQEKVATELGLAIRRLPTMAGHDSVALNAVVPTVMMFVPSIAGVSHCERELTSDADLLRGVDVLVGILDRMLNGELDDVHRR